MKLKYSKKRTSGKNIQKDASQSNPDDDGNWKKIVMYARAGSKRNLEQLCVLTDSKLSRYFSNITNDHELAQDWKQETMLKMVQSIRKLKKIECFWGWLYRIAANVVRTKFREKRNFSPVKFSCVNEYHLENVLRDERFTSSRHLDRKDFCEHLCQAVGKLKNIQLKVFSMRCFDNQSYDQICDTVGCSKISARQNFSRARKIIRKQLEMQGFAIN